MQSEVKVLKEKMTHLTDANTAYVKAIKEMGMFFNKVNLL